MALSQNLPSEIQRTYVTPSHIASFGGRNVLRDYYYYIDPDEVQKQQDEIYSYRRLRPRAKIKTHNPYYIRKTRKLLGLDLCDMPGKEQYNNGYRYFLTVIDTFSRRVWARPLRTKSTREVLAAFVDILTDMPRADEVKRVESDRGMEFLSGLFTNYLNSRGITLTHPNEHSPHVERVQRTLQAYLYRYMLQYATHRWVDKLQLIVNGYNNRKHRIIKMAPIYADEPIMRQRVINALQLYFFKAEKKKKYTPTYKLGQHILVWTKRHFQKGYEPTFRAEVFKIVRIKRNAPRPMYKLIDYHSNDVVGNFYSEELQRLFGDYFRIVVVQRQNRKGVPYIKYYWEGYNPDTAVWSRVDQLIQ